MKNTFSILALAATAAATGFKDAPAFPCPGNTDNHCTPQQLGGFDFSGLGFGSFSSYNNFNFKGWSCGSDNSKRFTPRTGGNKISGVCGHTKEESPSFGCGDKFSLGGVHVKPEFDCDLEFHYEMPGGSTCKHRTSCSSKGTDVKNDQCGGATSVTVVYPPQPTHTKTTCSIDIHTMTFDCSSSSTKPPPPKTTTKATTTKPTDTVATTTTQPTKGVDTTASSTKATETSPSTSVVETSPPAVTSPPVKTLPPFGNGTTIASTTSESIKDTTSETETTTEHTSTFVTSFLSTSTVLTTLTSTITSCAPTVTNCPAGHVTTTLITSVVTVTTCPVTETRTTVHTETKPTGGATVTASSVETSATAATTTATSSTPAETLPCPNVVPQCLNTFMFSVGCSDNSDSSCYCPDEIFVKNVFNCIYAHGESAQVVSEAVIFFQGICAPYVPTNPAIATGATVTSYITASATAPVVTTSLAPVYTTVTVEATTVVPCTDSAGSTIPSSSSTIVVSTAITVPNVAFTTGTGSASSVGLVPVTATATTAAAVTGGATKATTAGGATLVTAPAGTGGLTSKPSATGIVTVNSSNRVSAGFGLALAAMALVAAL